MSDTARTHDAASAFARRVLAISARRIAAEATALALLDFPDLAGHRELIEAHMSDWLTLGDTGPGIADAAAVHLATHPKESSR